MAGMRPVIVNLNSLVIEVKVAVGCCVPVIITVPTPTG